MKLMIMMMMMMTAAVIVKIYDRRPQLHFFNHKYGLNMAEDWIGGWNKCGYEGRVVYNQEDIDRSHDTDDQASDDKPEDEYEVDVLNRHVFECRQQNR